MLTGSHVPHYLEWAALALASIFIAILMFLSAFLTDAAADHLITRYPNIFPFVPAVRRRWGSHFRLNDSAFGCSKNKIPGARTMKYSMKNKIGGVIGSEMASTGEDKIRELCAKVVATADSDDLLPILWELRDAITAQQNLAEELIAERARMRSPLRFEKL